jgi:hypothetical protein
LKGSGKSGILAKFIAKPETSSIPSRNGVVYKTKEGKSLMYKPDKGHTV